MGQVLCCNDCIWYTQCQSTGISISLLCCNCWVCIPEWLEIERGQDCIKCVGCTNGCGWTFLCTGQYCCIPEWLRRYSLRVSIGDFVGVLGDMQVAIAVEEPQQS